LNLRSGLGHALTRLHHSGSLVNHLNAHDLTGAVAIVKGTARSMGIEVVN
jgi:hypothetical protein